MEFIETKLPGWLKPYLVNLKKFEYDGKQYEYAVVSVKLGAAFGENAPEMFTIKSQGILAISDSCPAEYCELFLVHEIIENPEAETLGDDACIEALQKELSLAKQQVRDFKDYVNFRLKFFGGLFTYYEKKIREDKEEKLFIRLQRSLAYLKKTPSSLEGPSIELVYGSRVAPWTDLGETKKDRLIIYQDFFPGLHKIATKEVNCLLFGSNENLEFLEKKLNLPRFGNSTSPFLCFNGEITKFIELIRDHLNVVLLNLDEKKVMCSFFEKS